MVRVKVAYTNSVVCGASKGCIYKQIKPPLVGEHAFSTDGVCLLGGSRYNHVSTPLKSNPKFAHNTHFKRGVGLTLK